MDKLWVDVPQGYLYGFPKVWDGAVDPPISEWLAANNYKGDTSYVRYWSYQEES